MRSLLPLVLVGVVAVIAARCSSGDGGDEPKPLARCEVDLSAWQGTGTGASARIATQADLLQGEAATGRVGDVVLDNGRVRIIVETPGPRVGTKPQGGNIIDGAAIVDGVPTADRFGELAPLFQFGRTLEYERIEILNDGSKGGAAVVAATGRDVSLDFIHLQGILRHYLSGVSLPDSDSSLGLRVTSYYLLSPDSPAVSVVQGLCYEGTEGIALAVGDIVNSGGDIEVFRAREGFSAAAGGPGDIAGALGDSPGEKFFGYVSMVDDLAYGILPKAERTQVLTISGVTGTLFNARSLGSWTTHDGPPPDGAVVLLAGEKATLARDFVVTRDPAGIYDYFYAKNAVATGTLSGRVQRADGSSVAKARVVALKADGTAASLFITDAHGAFGGQVPAGELSLRADDGAVRSEAVTVQVAAGATQDPVLVLESPGVLGVKIMDASGALMPGKVTVVCPDGCEHSRRDELAGRFRDVSVDRLPENALGETADIRYVGPEGRVDITLAPGTYDVWISRGLEWSLEKREVTVPSGGAANTEARLEHVVDTTGWVSGDFHVHAINSPDSPIANVERLKSFLAEGTDVIVASDHEHITDLKPILATIPGAGKHLRAITGLEATTFDYGHYNAFPLVADPSKRNGGAPDWGNGNAPGMTPGDLFEALHAFPGEQVVQLNHARGGFFSMLGVDTRTFWTRTDPANHRIRNIPADAATGDTRLFDDRFTALEIQNGTGTANFLQLMNDWFALMNRGLIRTGTAVSDTHKRHGSSGTPRTYVKMASEDLETLDEQAFARAINAHQAIGTNGPFLLVNVKSGATSGGPGDTVKSADGKVTVELEMRMPDWMSVSEVKLFSNATGTESNGLKAPPAALPEAVATVTLDFERVARGSSFAKVAKASVPLTLAKDAWIVAVFDGGSDLFPVVGKGGVEPRGFSNPVLVDVGGDGWTPPIDLAAERARVGRLETSGSPLRAAPTEQELRHVFEGHCSEEE